MGECVEVGVSCGVDVCHTLYEGVYGGVGWWVEEWVEGVSGLEMGG